MYQHLFGGVVVRRKQSKTDHLMAVLFLQLEKADDVICCASGVGDKRRQTSIKLSGGFVPKVLCNGSPGVPNSVPLA